MDMDMDMDMDTCKDRHAPRLYIYVHCLSGASRSGVCLAQTVWTFLFGLSVWPQTVWKFFFRHSLLFRQSKQSEYHCFDCRSITRPCVVILQRSGNSRTHHFATTIPTLTPNLSSAGHLQERPPQDDRW